MSLTIEHPVLILDDDVDFCDEIAAFLGRYHIPVRLAHTPGAAEAILVDHPISMLLLDVMLPERHGFDFCKQTRARMPDLPILFVSAYCDSFEQVLGFEAGADHFLRKPFMPQELLARMKAMQRRLRPPAPPDPAPAERSELRTRQGLCLNLTTAQASLRGARLKLTSFQFELLAHFVQNPQRLIPRAEVMTRINLYHPDVLSRSVDINVSRLRRALGDSAEEPRFIRTVWRKGYCFVDEVL